MWISQRTLFFFIAFGVIILSACGAASEETGVLPGDVQSTDALPSDLPTAVPTAAVPEITAQPALPERRRLTLEFPPQMRAGDADVVRLTLEVDDLGSVTPTAQIGGNVVTGEVVEIPNVYETHHVVAEARFDIAGVEIRPTELISQPISQGTSATFYWSIRPQGVGFYRGTIWLYLRFVDKQTGEESQKAVSAQIVEIETVSLLGLSGGVARATGVIGSIVGTVLGFPFFGEMIKIVFKKRNKRNP